MPPETEPFQVPQRPSLVKVTALLMLSKAVAFLLAFLREVVIAAHFGVSKIVDAYAAAFVLPNSIYTVFSNVINIAFLPQFIYLRTKYGESQALKTFRTLITQSQMVVMLIVVLSLVFAPKLIQWLASDVPADTLQQTVFFFRVLIFGVIFGVLYLYLFILHQAYERWNRPTFAPMAANLIGLLGLILGLYWWGASALPLSWFLATFVLALIFATSRIAWTVLRFSLRDPYVTSFYQLAFPIFLESVLLGVIHVLYRMLALSVGEGELAAFSYAQRLYFILCEVVFASFLPALYPRLSSAASEEDRQEHERLIRRALLGMTLITMGVVAVLGGLAQPLVEALFQRGRFTNQDSLKVAAIFQVFLGSFFFFIPLMVVNSAYHSIRKMMVPTFGFFLSAILVISLCYALIHPYRTQGIAVASMAGLGFQLILLLLLGKRFQISFPISQWLRLIAMGVPLMLTVWVALWQAEKWLSHVWTADVLVVKGLRLLMLMGLGAALFAVFAKLLRLPASDDLKEIVLRKWKSRA